MYYHIRYYVNGMYVSLERYNFDVADKMPITYLIKEMYHNDDNAIRNALKTFLIKVYATEEPIRETMDKVAEAIHKEKGSDSYDSLALTYLFDSKNDLAKEVTGEIKVFFGC